MSGKFSGKKAILLGAAAACAYKFLRVTAYLTSRDMRRSIRRLRLIFRHITQMPNMAI